MKILNLSDVKVSDKERKMLIDICSNLPKMNEALKDADIFDIETVRKALAIEMQGKRRAATVGRLVGRFKALATVEIDNELYSGK
jgi:hypothetical protein